MYTHLFAMADKKKIPNPNYIDVVRILRKHNGDPGGLMRLYPNFDPDVLPEANNGRHHVSPYLHQACFKNNFQAVRALVQCGASLLKRARFDRSTPLNDQIWSFSVNSRRIALALAQPESCSQSRPGVDMAVYDVSHY